MEDEIIKDGKKGIVETILVLIIPDKDYKKKWMNLVKELSTVDGKICYISLNTPYETLLDSFKIMGIDASKFYFIDAITKTATIPEESEKCEYVSSPGALTELSLAISNLLDSKTFDYLIFDSLSTLLVYENENTVTKFIHQLISKIRVMKSKAVFSILKQDTGSVLLKDINMFADRVLDIENWGAFR